MMIKNPPSQKPASIPPSPSSADANSAAEIRQRAEAQYSQQSRQEDTLSLVETQRLVHELGVHQIELEMQNDNLRDAHDELERRLDFINLFNFTSVGYFTMGSEGNILQVNISGEQLLNDDRQSLIGARFGLFVTEMDQPVFKAFLKTVFSTHVIQSCGVALEREDDEPMWVSIEGISANEGQECRITVQDITSRREMEEDLLGLNNTLEKRVVARTLELQQANRALTYAQETERRVLALEMNDELGQLLNVVKLSLEMVSMVGLEDGQKQVDDAGKLVGKMIKQVRRIMLELRPSMLDDMGLLPTLRWLFTSYFEQTGVHVQFTGANLDQRFEPQVEINAYRIIQAALTNIIRHSADKTALVEVSADAQSLRIQVSDHGNGFDLRTALGQITATGLSGMVERARQVGGKLTIDTQPGQGTTISAVLPLKG